MCLSFPFRNQNASKNSLPVLPYQRSTHGVCSDGVSANEVLEKGTLGLGTVAELDGEIIVIDNQAYHFTATGDVRCLTRNDTVPFAMMTYIQPSTVRYFNYLT